MRRTKVIIGKDTDTTVTVTIEVESKLTRDETNRIANAMGSRVMEDIATAPLIKCPLVSLKVK